MENLNDFLTTESSPILQFEPAIPQTFFQRLNADFEAGYLGWVGDFWDVTFGLPPTL